MSKMSLSKQSAFRFIRNFIDDSKQGLMMSTRINRRSNEPEFMEWVKDELGKRLKERWLVRIMKLDPRYRRSYLASEIDKFNEWLLEQWKSFTVMLDYNPLLEKKRSVNAADRKVFAQGRLAQKPMLNPITWKWNPETINLRQVEWLMERKRRLYKERKITAYTFRTEMAELAKLRKREIQRKPMLNKFH